MSRWNLLFHTIRYLKIRQLAYQVYYRVHRPRPRKADSPVLRGALENWRGSSFLEPATVDGETFTFLGKAARPGGDWNDPSLPKLWLYNLHYQDDLNSRGAGSRVELSAQMVDNWILGNPPLQGNGWEPYCLSLRIVNWVKWLSQLGPGKIKSEWLDSLATQADALEQQLEFHILANHLFANAKALVFVGTFLGGAEGDRYLVRGLKLLDEELVEQFLGDGAHFELSPMYHAILLWDMCDLLQLQRQTQLDCLSERTEEWCQVLVRGLEWLRKMVHPDGDIAFFNDATLGIAPTLDQIETYALSLGIAPTPESTEADRRTVHHSEPSGYVTVDWPGHHRAILDIGKVGPEYQPGHAHADTLSFELSVHGQRVFVNSGTSKYGVGPEREYQRGTAAHNTVEVDGENSSEVWAGFRVARRAQPLGVSVDEGPQSVTISGEHDGYRRLKGRVSTKRAWQFSEDCVQIIDELKGSFSRAVCRFYCHPDARPQQLREDLISVTLPNAQEVRLSVEGASRVQILDSFWYPGFGVSVPNSCIEITLSTTPLVSRIKF